MRSINTLTEVIRARAGDIEQHVSGQDDQWTLSSHADSTDLDVPAAVSAARRDIFEAVDELTAVLLGPFGYLMELTSPKYTTFIVLNVLYKFRIAEKIEPNEEVRYEELSARCGLGVDDLIRFMRMAIAFRIFEEPSPGRVKHSAISATLASNTSVRDWIGVSCEEFLPSIVNTVNAMTRWPGSGDPGHTGYALANGDRGGFYDILQKEPQRAQRFASAFGTTLLFPSLKISRLIELTGWQGNPPKSIVDIGGSSGMVCTELLRAFPIAHATVLDVPEVLQAVETPPDLKDRITFKPYNMFTEQTIHGADVYILRQILHNWSDTYAVQILKNQIPAMRKGTKLLINEICLPEPGSIQRTQEQLLRGFDLSMKHALNGMERDTGQWDTLLKTASNHFHLVDIRSSPDSQLSVIEVEWAG